MQAANRVHQALRGGKVSFGAWQMLPGANLSRVIARTPDIDWVCIDTEHGNISDDSMHASVAAIAACGVSPIVRVPEGQHWMLKRALDAGAHGIIVPLIQNAEHAQQVIQACKFPPRGTRGLGSPFSMEAFAPGERQLAPLSQKDYLQQANDSILTILQIETKSALADVPAIAALPGLDVLLIGPYDLGNSIGHPIVRPEFDEELLDAIHTIRRAAQEQGKKAAIFATSGAQAGAYAAQGFNMVNILVDVGALQNGFATASEQAASG